MAVHRLALDFDDVVSDTSSHVLEAFAAAGHPIPPHIHRYEDWNGLAPFTREESNTIVFSVTASLELTEVIPPIDGAIEGVREVEAMGVSIDILTARGAVKGEIVAAQCFLAKHGLGHLPIVGTALQPKGWFVDGHTLALDDSVGDLLSMPTNMCRLLFRRPRNETFWRMPTQGIFSIRDWPHAVSVIRDIVRG